MEKKSKDVEIEAEIGRITVENGAKLVPEHQPKERIYTLCHKEISLLAGANMSYHKGLDLLNRLLHRSPSTTIKFRTYRDFCERTGMQIEESIARETRQILNEHHFESTSGKATDSIAPELQKGAECYEDSATIRSAIEEINATRANVDEQVKATAWQIERAEQTCNVSFDDIGVKHQKEHRKESSDRNGVYVWNTVADVEANGTSRIMTGVGMHSVFLLVLAYLLQNNLLAGRSLVFFTDGARSIFTNIAEVFSFHPYTVILDWYHLKKRCQECLSMSAKGKERRNEILQKLLRILWAGNVDEAIAFLHNLDATVLRPNNRINELCQYIEKHREHIPPYALRAKLGLRNSSNRVEKANDLVVAQRQKHNGMSWSTSGSGALAQISALVANGELKSWLNPSDSADDQPLAA